MRLEKAIAMTALMGVVLSVSACRKKIYLEQPEVKPAAEQPPRDPAIEATEKRIPYAVDQPVVIIEETPPPAMEEPAPTPPYREPRR